MICVQGPHGCGFVFLVYCRSFGTSLFAQPCRQSLTRDLRVQDFKTFYFFLISRFGSSWHALVWTQNEENITPAWEYGVEIVRDVPQEERWQSQEQAETQILYRNLHDIPTSKAIIDLPVLGLKLTGKHLADVNTCGLFVSSMVNNMGRPGKGICISIHDSQCPNPSSNVTQS